jgi:hypothetical protein
MMKQLLGLLALAALFVALPSLLLAQPKAEWDPDTVVYTQEGCYRYSDSILVAYSNTGTTPVTITDYSLNGWRWKVSESAESRLPLTLMPGEEHIVKLNFKGVLAQFNRDTLVLATQGGTTDTLWLMSDINANSLAYGYYAYHIVDTSRWLISQIPGAPIEAVINLYPMGGLPFEVESYSLDLDPTMTATPYFQKKDTISPNDMVVIHFKPTAEGVYAATFAIKAKHCDSVFKATIVYEVELPSLSLGQIGAYMIAPDCKTPTSATLKLYNTEVEDELIDSVRITGDNPKHFTLAGSAPANRFKDFILPAGDTVVYTFELNLNSASPATKYAYFEVFSRGRKEATQLLIGQELHARLFPVDTLQLYMYQVEEDQMYMSRITNSGTKPFRITSISTQGQFPVTFENLAVDTVIEANSTHEFNYHFRGDSLGEQATTIILEGDECDSSLTIVLLAEFAEFKSVDRRPSDVRALEVAGGRLSISGLTQATSFEIVDVTGRTMMRGETTGPIELASLPAGAYLLRLEDGSTYKFTKLR